MTLSARFALAMVFLVVVTTFALSLITYYFVTEAVIPRGLDRLATEAALGATEIEAVLSGARQDLMLIQGGAMVTQMVATRSKDHGALQADAEIRRNIAARFLPLLKIKPTASSRSKGNATTSGGPCRSRPLKSTFPRSGSSRVATGIPPPRCFKSARRCRRLTASLSDWS